MTARGAGPARSHPVALQAGCAAARSGIAALNARHPGSSGDRFFLFHRLRQWNAREGLWMGWERKRGKIEEFNRLLRGAADTSFEEGSRMDALLRNLPPPRDRGDDDGA